MDAFPDNQARVQLLIADGNDLAEESVFEGTNSGPLQGPDGTQTPATGRRASQSFTQIHTVRGDKIASSTTVLRPGRHAHPTWDDAGLRTMTADLDQQHPPGDGAARGSRAVAIVASAKSTLCGCRTRHRGVG
jgi:hypothetical protein